MQKESEVAGQPLRGAFINHLGAQCPLTPGGRLTTQCWHPSAEVKNTQRTRRIEENNDVNFVIEFEMFHAITDVSWKAV